MNTLLKEQFVHSENKNSLYGISLFSDITLTVYPDFYSKARAVVLDAKYKILDNSEKGIKREDRYQIISYLHVLEANKAGVVHPSKSADNYIHVGKLNGFGGSLFKLPLMIPQKVDTYESFVSMIHESEESFISSIVKI